METQEGPLFIHSFIQKKSEDPLWLKHPYRLHMPEWVDQLLGAGRPQPSLLSKHLLCSPECPTCVHCLNQLWNITYIQSNALILSGQFQRVLISIHSLVTYHHTRSRTGSPPPATGNQGSNFHHYTLVLSSILKLHINKIIQ